jgi:ribonuclease BN (tRNA processing enzyme)
MKLVCLGTTGYHPNDRRQTACFMLPELGVVLDAGTGMYRVIDHAATPHLDIFLTHAHLDHVMGLTFLLDIMHARTFERVTVHAVPEKLEGIHAHLFAEPLFPVLPKCEFRPLAQSVPLGGGGKLTHFPLIHPGGCVGFRIDWPNRSMAYVTDTTAAANSAYIEHIRGVHLLIHECYFPDGMTSLAELTGHSCTSEVAQVARSAGVGRMLLVHVNPLSTADDPIGLPTARGIFPNTEIAEDGMQVEF